MADQPPNGDAKSLFSTLRTDPKKADDGVWIEHPETGDSFLCRRLWCPAHARAYLEAQAAWEQKRTKKPETEDEIREVYALSLAAGLVKDWKLKGSDRAYDKSIMAAALADPELRDLVKWIELETVGRARFRPDLGN